MSQSAVAISSSEGSLSPAARVELILSQVSQLPTLPAVAVQVLAATQSADSSAADVVRLIQADSALTAKILKLLTRADLGVRDEVVSIDRAVVLLGFDAVRNAVLSLQVYETFASVEPGEGSVLIREEFWKHSLAVACAAEMAARAASKVRVDPGEAFVCGLLHDVGKIALDACLPKSYGRVIAQCEMKRVSICDAERAVLGLDHTQAGKRLLDQWSLPRSVVECAWLHHHDELPESVQGRDVVQVVHWADNVVRRQRIGFSGCREIEPIEPGALRLGIAAAELARLLEQLPRRMETLSELFGLGAFRAEGVYTRAIADANAELGRLNAELTETNRRLTARSRAYEAIRAFVTASGERDGVGDVCAAGAEAVGRLFDAREVVTAALGPGPLLHAGFWSAGQTRRAGRCFDPSVLGPDPGWLRPETGEVLAPAPHALQRVWRIVRECDPPPDCCVLYVRHAGRVIGAAMFEPGLTPPSQRAGREEGESLSSALGMALASAAARADAERLSEDLLDLNRRLKSAQHELLRTRSLSMIAEMAAGAAHELNTPLAVISGRAQILARETEDENLRRDLQTIIQQARRASDMVTELSHFAKPDAPRKARTLLKALFERQYLHWQERLRERGVECAFEVHDEAAGVYADAEQTLAVLDALIANALEAAPSAQPRVQVNSAPGATDETVRISVTDNGSGMTPDVVQKAFDPFYSNRQAGRGRGLGLSRAQRLAEINGGRLWLESDPQHGTTATLELPARED
ncbi:MAG: HDOD domain-containing protein [Phycisphaerales bacterium]|nr:MAG: HDOD domain-containing protein [Phycisphaerales bacterium]